MLSSVTFNIRLSIRKITLEHKQRLHAKFKKLSLSQDRPLEDQNFDSIRTLDNTSLPTFVIDLLCYGPTHQIRDKFNEVHFLADIDKLVRTLRESGADGEKLCEIEILCKMVR